MTKQGYFHRVSELTPTRVWVNNVTVQEARKAIEAGAVSCTQNPSFVWKMLESDPENTLPLLDGLLDAEGDDNEVLILLQKALIERVAAEFYPLYERSRGKYGYVTVQGDPFQDTDGEILRQARLNTRNMPNIMAKIPVIPEALPAIETLAAEGKPLCLTEIMAVRQALDGAEAYLRGSAALPHPAPCVLAHIAGIYDEYLGNAVRGQGIDISPDILWQAGIAVAKKVHALLRDRRYPVEFLGGGVRGVQHFTEAVGAVGAVTMNWQGASGMERLLEQNPVVISRFHAPTPEPVLDELLAKLPDFRRAYEISAITPEEYAGFGPVALFRGMFEAAWKQALDAVSRRRRERRKGSAH